MLSDRSVTQLSYGPQMETFSWSHPELLYALQHLRSDNMCPLMPWRQAKSRVHSECRLWNKSHCY